jgi:hypothetical protein
LSGKHHLGANSYCRIPLFHRNSTALFCIITPCSSFDLASYCSLEIWSKSVIHISVGDSSGKKHYSGLQRRKCLLLWSINVSIVSRYSIQPISTDSLSLGLGPFLTSVDQCWEQVAKNVDAPIAKRAAAIQTVAWVSSHLLPLFYRRSCSITAYKRSGSQIGYKRLCFP